MDIWCDSPITPTATGTGTDVTTIVTWVVPSGVAELVAVRGHVTSEAPAPAEGVCGVFAMGGQDWKYSPYEWLSEIGGSHLGAIDGCAYAVEPRWWEAHIPLKAGSTIGVTYEPLDALAANGEFLIDVVYASEPTGLQPVQRLCSRETASSTTTGASITISDAAVLVDFSYAFVPGGVLVADEEVTSRITVTSGSINRRLSLGNIVHGIEATSGQSWTTLMKREINIQVVTRPCIFNSSIVVTSSSTNADAYAYGIGYIPIPTPRG